MRYFILSGLALATTYAFAGEPAAQSTSAAGSPGWFVGTWAAGTAEIEGYENIFGKVPDCKASIANITLEEDKIILFSVPYKGQTYDSRFEVRPNFGGNYPWWAVRDPAGPNMVSRVISENSFQLASVNPNNGKGDWQNATQYWRCPLNDEETG